MYVSAKPVAGDIGEMVASSTKSESREIEERAMDDAEGRIAHSLPAIKHTRQSRAKLLMLSNTPRHLLIQGNLAFGIKEVGFHHIHGDEELLAHAREVFGIKARGEAMMLCL